jgi:hypothetical protein
VFLFFALYWNKSIAREVTLDHAVPSDGLSAPNLEIGRGGQLLNTTRDVLLDGSVTSASFANASVAAHQTDLTLWHADGVPRLRTLIVGRYANGWLNESTRIRLWHQGSLAGGRRYASALGFTLSLPRTWTETAHMKIGNAHFTIKPGSEQSVVCWNAKGPLDVLSSTHNVLMDEAGRLLAVQMSRLDVTGAPIGRTGTGCAAKGAAIPISPGATAQKASAAVPAPRRAPRPAL